MFNSACAGLPRAGQQLIATEARADQAFERFTDARRIGRLKADHAEKLAGPTLMLVHRPSSRLVESTQRRDVEERNVQLLTEVLEQRPRHALNGIKRPPAHPEKPDLQGGAVAAEMACSLMAQSMRTTIAGTPELWARCLVDVDQALVRQGSGGQCTAVVVEISENHVSGASVGDSGAWMITSREILDLTERQRRKPLLGSGEASPVSFGQIPLSGRLLLATDGLFKYATRRDIRERAFVGLSVSTAVETLVEGLRLRSGAFQDDVAIILVECVV
jgi:hypothetical protein